MTCESVVRVAKPGDFDEVARLLTEAHAENSLFESDRDRVRWWVNRLLHPELIHPADTGVRGIIGVIGPTVGEQLEAVIIITIGQFWYSNQRHLEEFLVFVDANHRRSRHAQAMLKFMRSQVEATGLPLITGVISNTRTEAKCNLYRKFLPKAGEFFFLTPKGSSLPEFAVQRSTGW